MIAAWMVSGALAQSFSVVVPTRAEPCVERGDTQLVPDLTDQPSGDPQYDHYVPLVEDFGADFPEPVVTPQVGEGMATLHGGLDGSVFGDLISASQVREQWFVHDPQPQYDGLQPFELIFDDEDGTVSTDGFADDATWLYMDVKYRSIPADAPFDWLGLGYANGPTPENTVLSGLAFTVTVDGVLVGQLLRERHSNKNWVDYWLFTEDFVRLGQLEADGTKAQVLDAEPWVVQPASAADFFAAVPGGPHSHEWFSKVQYKARKVCGYYEFVKSGVLRD